MTDYRMVGQNNDEKFMEIAINEAETALRAGEFPVGCVITDGAVILASGFRITSRGSAANEIDHAEIMALRDLSENHPGIKKTHLCMYITLEPCLMCFGAILISGIRRIAYAFEDIMGGGTKCDRRSLPPLYRDIELDIVSGICRNKSLSLIRHFFSNPANSYLKNSLFSEYALHRHQ